MEGYLYYRDKAKRNLYQNTGAIEIRRSLSLIKLAIEEERIDWRKGDYFA